VSKECNGLEAIVQCLVEIKKNKISLDFCLAHAYLFIGVRESPKVDFFSAMEKKREQHFNYDDIKANKYFNKNKKVDLL
jgi:hypothetical protein